MSNDRASLTEPHERRIHVSRIEVIRAWKDEEYFSSLSEIERMLLPQNPAGFIELSDDQLGGAIGAADVLGSCYTCPTGTTTFESTLTLPPL